ncbi:unnamed protein product, partial [Sphenostylis stenocarpa]
SFSLHLPPPLLLTSPELSKIITSSFSSLGLYRNCTRALLNACLWWCGELSSSLGPPLSLYRDM